VYDFGAAMDPKGGAGYGAMQIHNWKAKQTILCFNKFGSGHTCDLGLGNSEGKTRDWTFTSSAKDLAQAQLLVLVLP
jgi:sialate O-acetylesterase